MKAPPEDFLDTIDVAITTWWSVGRTADLRNVKLDITRKQNSTFMPYGTSSKFTNMYRSPRLAGSLPLSCGNSRELFTVIDRYGLTACKSTWMI